LKRSCSKATTNNLCLKECCETLECLLLLVSCILNHSCGVFTDEEAEGIDPVAMEAFKKNQRETKANRNKRKMASLESDSEAMAVEMKKIKKYEASRIKKRMQRSPPTIEESLVETSFRESYVDESLFRKCAVYGFSCIVLSRSRFWN